MRAMTQADIPAAMRMKDEAGWNQTDADWHRLLAAGPEGCFVALLDDTVVGTVTTITYEGKVSWVGMVLVDSAHRGHGIGTGLLERAIAHLDGKRVASIKLDATPAGRPLYEKLGFIPEYQVERWALTRATHERAVNGEPVDLKDVFSLDRDVFGIDRSMLLAWLREAAPELALVSRRGSEIQGYTFGRHGSLADQLGPWVAISEGTAATLLDRFLQESRRRVFVDCVEETKWSLPLVKSRGFTFSRPLTRMYRGRNDHRGMPNLMGAVLGPEFG
ncbi:MAG: GNAT family N-acetyltransferase [Acidobacteriota bacterium]|nr:GNAT family N-acetyltransferase [Acidobacteriota bacterium]